MNRLDAAITEVVATAPAAPGVGELQLRNRHRRAQRAKVSVLAVVLLGGAGAIAVARSVGGKSTSPPVVVSPPTTSVASTSTSTSTTAPNPRTAAGNVPYVEQLVRANRLAHAEAVTRVSADGSVVVVTTTLTDRTSARELWEDLARHLSCDDSYLLITGERVVMADGTRVTEGVHGFDACAGT